MSKGAKGAGYVDVGVFGKKESQARTERSEGKVAGSKKFTILATNLRAVLTEACFMRHFVFFFCFLSIQSLA
jgi:hypothetical protein